MQVIGGGSRGRDECLESLRKMQDVQEVMGGDCRGCDERKRRRRVEAGTRRGNGDAGNQSFFGTVWKAFTWTLMVKVTMSGSK